MVPVPAVPLAVTTPFAPIVMPFCVSTVSQYLNAIDPPVDELELAFTVPSTSIAVDVV